VLGAKADLPQGCEPPRRWFCHLSSNVGVTSDVDQRLEWHNHGLSGHTIQDRPWSPVAVIEFLEERDAVGFERYLESGSGRAFTKRHFGASARALATRADG
jgi:putative endonuclease